MPPGTRSLYQTTATVLSVSCAVVVTAAVVAREIRDWRADQTHPEPTAVADFPQLASEGHRAGPAQALVTVVEFVDFECGACRHFAEKVIGPLQDEFPEDVAIVTRHWPLPSHRFAMAAARAGICAGEQGRFEAMRSTLFHLQDSIGLKTWAEMAVIAGITDTTAFNACTKSATVGEWIDRDIATVKQLGGRGTPTVLVNGNLYHHMPDLAELRAALRSARKLMK
jgi:protein-disulfide isomerase